jgi:hypothetical protein
MNSLNPWHESWDRDNLVKNKPKKNRLKKNSNDKKWKKNIITMNCINFDNFIR